MAGLSACVNLHHLNLSENNISDLADLRPLTVLRVSIFVSKMIIYLNVSVYNTVFHPYWSLYNVCVCMRAHACVVCVSVCLLWITIPEKILHFYSCSARVCVCVCACLGPAGLRVSIFVSNMIIYPNVSVYNTVFHPYWSLYNVCVCMRAHACVCVCGVCVCVCTLNDHSRKDFALLLLQCPCLCMCMCMLRSCWTWFCTW